MTNQGYASFKSLTQEDNSTPREQQVPSTSPALQCAAGGRPAPSSDPATICACLSHRKFWRSIYGPHLICASCHPPVRESAVAAWIDVGDRSETMVVALATARARMRARPRQGPYLVMIQTAVGWSQSRNRFRRFRTAKRSALWFASLPGVWQARVIDLHEQARVVAEFKNHNRKPR